MLVDLPNELLLKIFDDEELSLPTVALVCRRFNHLIISIFLTSRGISDPTEFLPVHLDLCQDPRHSRIPPHNNDDLCFLSVAVAITSVKCISFHLTLGPLAVVTTSTDEVLKLRRNGYLRLSRFIRKLTRVNKVVLNLECRRFIDIHGNMDLPRWVTPTADALNACIEKGCEELHVSNGYWAPGICAWVRCNATSGRLPSFFKKVIALRSISGTYATLKGPDWEIKSFSRLHGQPQMRTATAMTSLSSSARKRSNLRLTSLRISSPLLMLPPLSKWLYQLLTVSSLMKLAFVGIELQTNMWHAVFSWMLDTPLPKTLRELDIQRCSILPRDPLIGFISKLKALCRLELHPPLPLFIWENSSQPLLDLPNLTSMAAPSDFLDLFPCSHSPDNLTTGTKGYSQIVSRFLGSKSNANQPQPTTPRLTSLHIIVQELFLTPTSRQRIHQIISNLSPNDATFSSITVEIRPLQPAAYATLPKYRELLPNEETPTPLFKLVTDLVLPSPDVHDFIISQDPLGLDSFSRSISSMFPNLMRIKIYEVSASAEDITDIRRWERAGFEWMVRGLKRTLATLQSGTAVIVSTGGREDEPVYEVTV